MIELYNDIKNFTQVLYFLMRNTSISEKKGKQLLLHIFFPYDVRVENEDPIF